MELVSTPWHVISAALVFFLGLIVSYVFAKKVKVYTLTALGIYLWHTLMCFVYMSYALKNPADANRYFNSNSLNILDFSLGTTAVELITTALKVGLDLSYLGCFLAFNILGTIGLLAFSGTLKQLTQNSSSFIKWFAIVLTFLPSVSFWSAAIGKDSLSFMATGLALWASLNLNQRKILFICAVLIMLLVRPHMAGLMIMAISVAIIFDKNSNVKTKSLMSIISIASLVVLIPFALNYAGVKGDISAEKMGTYFKKKQEHNMEGGSSLDISSMILPMKMFTYVFRPLPFEAHNVTALLASLDNVLLLGLLLYSSKYLRDRRLKFDPSNRLFMWAYVMGSLIILSLTTANLGIAMRQKWMFLPMLIYLLLSAVVFAKQRLHNKNVNS